MACNPEVLKHVPLFALLDEEETAVLACQVRLSAGLDGLRVRLGTESAALRSKHFSSSTRSTPQTQGESA